VDTREETNIHIVVVPLQIPRTSCSSALGGVYGYRQYGGPGLGAAIALVLVVFLMVWLAGGLRMG